MDPNCTLRSVLSFRPLMRAWEKASEEGRPGTRLMYRQLLDKVRQHPELLEPIKDLDIIDRHKNLVEEMMATVFPITLSDENDLFGGAIPFRFTLFYASQKLKKQFLNPNGRHIVMPDCGSEQVLKDGSLTEAYQLVFSRLFNMPFPDKACSVHTYKCPNSGLQKYMELEIDTRFIDIHVKGDLPELPGDYANCTRPADIAALPYLKENLPLSLFEFEGMVIVNVRDVTEREVLNVIRDQLLDLHTFSAKKIFQELQEQVQNLISVPDVHTAIKPFFKINNQLVLSQTYTTATFNDKIEPSEEMLRRIHEAVVEAFKHTEQPLIIREVNEEAVYRYPFIVLLEQMGWKSAIICPLFADNHDVLGVLIIVSKEIDRFTTEHIARIERAIPLFKLAMEKSQENLDHQVDRVIKDQFTAVQDAVEWRFTQEALRYLARKNKEDKAKINPIVFNEVYPLYGAIDIRNSSIERNHAIQLDLLEQLNLANDIIQLAIAEYPYPLLDEVAFKLRKYIHSVSNILFSDEEISILQFLKQDLIELFTHLKTILPALQPEIARYMEAIDSPVEMVYHHRKEYEESITTINTAVAAFIDKEQLSAQNIFPHYFERFVTDGVDFNIYIGQSINPDKKFDFFYLKNLKIWQLSTLAKAARLTHYLAKDLPLHLQTSQLILAHSHPISISFRTAERKFDVDGAYNIRYEIIKKRIDKVHIKDSNERLTLPGHIAIVYSQQEEANEYMEYVEYLSSIGLLKGEVEKFELEELQGVSGLKGLRVAINLEDEQSDVRKNGKKSVILKSEGANPARIENLMK